MFPSRVDDRPTAYLQPPTAIPGAGATGGTLRPGKGIAGLAAAGLALLSGKGKTTIPPGTGGPRRGGGFGGRGGKPTPPGTGGGSGRSGGGFFKRIKQTYQALKEVAILSSLGLAVCAVLALSPKFREMTKMEQDNICYKVSEYILYILAVFVAGGLSIVAIRNIVPRIKRALSNREAIKNIIEALDMDDEETAREILHDAIEDQGINLSAVKRALSPYEYQRLMDDM